MGFFFAYFKSSNLSDGQNDTLTGFYKKLYKSTTSDHKVSPSPHFEAIKCLNTR